MPGCAAPNCSNSGAKGHVMKVFPCNEERRILWARNTGGMNWMPQKHHRLCEVSENIITIADRESYDISAGEVL